MMEKVKAQVTEKVAGMKVVEMRKVATTVGIKQPSKYKREVLSVMLVDALTAIEVAKLEAQQKANKAKATKHNTTETKTKCAKADKVSDDEVEALADAIIANHNSEGLLQVNRKVLIMVMKKLHCKRWYRTYDKPTMVKLITDKFAA